MTNPKSRRTLSGPAMTVSAVVKALCGALLATLVVVAWQQLATLEERRELSDSWSDTRDFAVFYPYSVGNDRTEQASGGHTSKITESRDLYPMLDEAGAVFIDSSNYEPGAPINPALPSPAPPIRVNANYLERYPIMDESGDPIDIDRDETDWVLAVPQQYRSRKAELEEFFQATRTGGQGIEGAVQAQESIVGEPAPEKLADQKVRIVFTASEQDVFSFNTKVNPDGGNMIADPLVEIMTPANNMTVDRLNAITGEMNTPLKVRVDGDPSSTFSDLSPTLDELDLDDNLRHLVTGQEAILAEIGEIRSAVAWAGAFGLGALLVMLTLNATLVIIAADRLRRKLTVRRLHGVGFTRTWRELLNFLAATWLGQALAALVGVVALGVYSRQTSGGFGQTPRLLAVLAASLVVEALFVAVTAGIVERRNAVKRLKER